MYYSRSENDNGEKEELKYHLKKVRKLCREFACEFDEGVDGEWLGTFHDAGKASDNFQKILDKTEHYMNHEAAGACILYKISPLLAKIIYAHHKGIEWNIEKEMLRLANQCGSRDKINRRFTVSGKEELNKAFEYIKNNVGIPKEKPQLMKNSECHNKNIPEMLHARMLLSCLADADYTASASHNDEDIIEKSTDIPLNYDRIIKNLSDYRRKIIKGSDSDSGLNEIRNEVFDSCTESAKIKSGLFTLTAPTGTGKTLALLSFAAENAKKFGKKRIIIVLPYLSIINQNAKIYREICENVLEAHSMAVYDEKTRMFSERWTSPVIITTSVKLFESLFKYKPSDMRFIHSIANSVIVFDEAQSIPHELISSTIETVNVLCEMFKCTVLFSTATQPEFGLRKDILKYKPYEIIADTERMFDSVRRVDVCWDIKREKSFDEIAEMMSEHRSICCVVNRKDHAYKLYKKLCETDSDNCYHISTDMCKEHRDDVLKKIYEKTAANEICRLVSTSCIEAGVDLDFEYMFRALAPLDSIIQCAGRCNRNGRNKGLMTVFIPDEEKKYPSASYENAALKVKLILSRHEIDIYSPEHIREYYRELFSQYSADKDVLTHAIEDYDFAETEKQYKFIPSSGSDVLVPYEKSIELYNELCKEARTKGISKDWIRRAAPITVSSYRKDKLDEICEKCFIIQKGKRIILDGWYILNESRFYNEKAGLHFEDDSSLNYCI